MAISEQIIKDRYAIYNGDCIDVMKKMPNESVHLSIYSPPFCGLYQYSSNPKDLSNCDDKKMFFDHYKFVVSEISRITFKGRITAVHCTDIPSGNSGADHLYDFPGDIIRLHEDCDFQFIARHTIWKEPLGVRNRTMCKNLAHQTVVQDAAYAGVASADYLLIFRKKGENKTPIENPSGLEYYAGENGPPSDLYRYKGWKGKQTENRYSHWIWRHYASSVWDDIRLLHVLPYKESKTEEDEKHVHPLQLDVIDRCVVLRSNKGEVVFTPFMGVGSGTYSAVMNGRKAIGVELKKSYFNQAIKNMEQAEKANLQTEELSLF